MPALLVDIGANIARLTTDVAKANTTLEGFAKRTEASFAGIATAAKSVAGAFGIAFGAQQIGQLLKMGLAAEQTELSFKRMASSAGDSADRIVESMKKVTKGTIDVTLLMQKAIKGMALDLTGDQLIALAEAARTSSRITGKAISETFDAIIDSVATKMPRALKQMGLITAEQMELFNQAVSAGAKQVELFDIVIANSQKQQKQLGNVAEDNKEIFDRFTTSVSNLGEEFGKQAVSGLRAWYDIFVKIGDYISENRRRWSESGGELILGKIPPMPSNISGGGKTPEQVLADWQKAIDKTKEVEKEYRELAQVLWEVKLIADELHAEFEEGMNAMAENAKKMHDADIDAYVHAEITKNEMLQKEIEKQESDAKKLNEFIIKEQEAALQKQLREYEHFLERIYDATADTFYEIFTGQIDSWGDFLDKMKDMFLKWLSELAAQAIMRPIIVPILSGIGGALGMPSIASAFGVTGGGLSGNILSALGLGGAAAGGAAGGIGAGQTFAGAALEEGMASTAAGAGGGASAAAYAIPAAGAAFLMFKAFNLTRSNRVDTTTPWSSLNMGAVPISFGEGGLMSASGAGLATNLRAGAKYSTDYSATGGTVVQQFYDSLGGYIAGMLKNLPSAVASSTITSLKNTQTSIAEWKNWVWGSPDWTSLMASYSTFVTNSLNQIAYGAISKGFEGAFQGEIGGYISDITKLNQAISGLVNAGDIQGAIDFYNETLTFVQDLQMIVDPMARVTIEIERLNARYEEQARIARELGISETLVAAARRTAVQDIIMGTTTSPLAILNSVQLSQAAGNIGNLLTSSAEWNSTRQMIEGLYNQQKSLVSANNITNRIQAIPSLYQAAEGFMPGIGFPGTTEKLYTFTQSINEYLQAGQTYRESQLPWDFNTAMGQHVGYGTIAGGQQYTLEGVTPEQQAFNDWVRNLIPVSGLAGQAWKGTPTPTDLTTAEAYVAALSSMTDYYSQFEQHYAAMPVNIEDLVTGVDKFNEEFKKAFLGQDLVTAIENLKMLDSAMLALAVNSNQIPESADAIAQMIANLGQLKGTVIAQMFQPLTEIIKKHELTDYQYQLSSLNDWYKDQIKLIEALKDVLSTDEMASAYDQLTLAAKYQAEDLIQNYLVPFETNIQNFIDSLTVSDFAPVQSFETMMNRYQQLLTSASQGSTEALSELESFITSTFLPFVQVYTQGTASYKTIWDQIMADLGTIPETIMQGAQPDYSLGGLQIDPALLAILQAAGLIHTQGGGYITGNSIVNIGEKGPEWVVPTYDPERSKFLRDVGADPDIIARKVADRIGGGTTERQPIYLMVDGKILAGVIIEQGRKNGEYIKSIKSIART